MGCGGSKALEIRYNDLLTERDMLALEYADLQKQLLDLQLMYDECNKTANEQSNLYRFKIEIMSQMLAVEEKKMQASSKRLEALKLAMLNEGISNKTMDVLLRTTTEGIDAVTVEQKISALTAAFDIAGAINRLSLEMREFPEDIIHAFADSEGKIFSSLSRDEFMRYLYNATESLSKADVQILSFRFYDGSTVSVPEFIDFFTSSLTARVAKSAASAVRASLNMLQLEHNNVDEGNEDTFNGHVNVTSNLQNAVRKLMAVWGEVEDEICTEFNDIEEHVGGGYVVQTDTFEEILDGICGEKRRSDMKKIGTASRESLSKWLSLNDIGLIAARFEVGDRVDANKFLHFFQDAHGRPDSAVAIAAIAPFRFSAEWSKLKKDTSHTLPITRSGGPETNEIADVTDVYDDDLPLPQLSKSSALGLSQTSVGILEPKIDSQSNRALLHSENSKVSGSKSFDSITSSYQRNPIKFAEDIKNSSDNDMFTPLTIKSCLRKLCKDAAGDELQAFVCKLPFVGGRCTSSDVIRALVDIAGEIPAMKSPEIFQTDNSIAFDGNAIQIAINRVHSRAESIKLLEQEAELDMIFSEYRSRPKEFMAALASKAKGNALSKDDLEVVLNTVASTPTLIEVTTFMTHLEPKFRLDTNDVLVSAIENYMKSRLQHTAKIEKEILVQRKALEVDKARVTRMQERASKIVELKKSALLDPITQQYQADPKSFTTDFTSKSSNDHLINILASIVPSAKLEQLQSIKDESASKIDKNEEIPVSAVLSILSSRINASKKVIQLIRKEETAQDKDANAAAGIKSGGCCGGSYKDTHDPSMSPSSIPADNLPITGDGPDAVSLRNQPHLEEKNDTAQNAGQSNAKIFRRGDTSDTLTFSDGGSGREDKHSDDDISVDSRSLNGRKNVPMPEGIAGSSTRSSFRKPMNRVSRDKPSKNADDEYYTDEDKESERGAVVRRNISKRRLDVDRKRIDPNKASAIEHYSSENSDEEPFSTLRK